MSPSRIVSLPGAAALAALLVIACAAPRPTPDSVLPTDRGRPPEAAVIARVLAADDAAGTRRNHACETVSLEEAVLAYLDELGALDLQDCPDDFADAFLRHQRAWRSSIGLFARYPDLRGEMHELFEEIRARDAAALRSAEAEIWGTWDEVEAAARRHGAIATPGE